MQKFKQYAVEKQIQNQIMESVLLLQYISENNERLNEESVLTGFSTKINQILPKLGLKLHKGDGIVSYIAKFATVGGKMLIAAIKGNKEEVKRLSTTIERGEFIDFLFKLDMVSLHLVTNPIHMIDAITGWDLMANLKSVAQKASNTIKDIINGINQLKTKIVQVLDTNVAKPIISFFDELETTVTATV